MIVCIFSLVSSILSNTFPSIIRVLISHWKMDHEDTHILAIENETSYEKISILVSRIKPTDFSTISIISSMVNAHDHACRTRVKLSRYVEKPVRGSTVMGTRWKNSSGTFFRWIDASRGMKYREKPVFLSFFPLFLSFRFLSFSLSLLLTRKRLWNLEVFRGPRHACRNISAYCNGKKQTCN